MSLNIIKYNDSPETENKQQDSSGFGAGKKKKRTQRNTVHAYNNSYIKNPSAHITEWSVKDPAKWTLNNEDSRMEQSVYSTDPQLNKGRLY